MFQTRALLAHSSRNSATPVEFYKIGLELAMSGSYFELMEWLLAKNNACLPT